MLQRKIVSKSIECKTQLFSKTLDIFIIGKKKQLLFCSLLKIFSVPYKKRKHFKNRFTSEEATVFPILQDIN